VKRAERYALRRGHTLTPLLRSLMGIVLDYHANVAEGSAFEQGEADAAEAMLREVFDVEVEIAPALPDEAPVGWTRNQVIASHLRAHPGKWALVYSRGSAANKTNIESGYLVDFRDSGFEAFTVRNATGYDTYARWVRE